MKKIILSIAAIILVSCSATISPDSKLYKSVVTQYSNHGKEMFESKCSKCHDLPSRTSFTADEWKGIMLRMQSPAKITDEEREAIYTYIVTP